MRGRGPAKTGLAGSALILAASLLFLLPAALSGAAGGDERTLGVVYADGAQTEDVPLYRIEEGSEEFFVSAYDLARVFRATKFWNPSSRKLVLRLGIHRYVLTIDTRVVIVDDTPVLMTVPVRYERGAVMIPLEFVSDVLRKVSTDRIELDEERLLLTIGSPDYNITEISFAEDEDGTRAILALTEELLYHVDAETAGLLRLKIYGGRLNPLKFSITEGTGLFNRVRAEQAESDSYLFFDVKKRAERFRVEFESRGENGTRRLVIFLEKGELPEIPGVEYAGKRMLEIMEEAPAGGRKSAVRRVAVDPGHGGIDNGKVSRSGLKEKDVNLEIALLLRERLVDELGVEFVMTRTEDELVPLESRAEKANSAGADLFISIHCNGWFHPDAGGFETFFLAPPRTEEEARLAREENASVFFENSRLRADEMEDLEFILWDMVQNEFITGSSELAELIQKELSSLLNIRNRGVKQAGLKVLKGLRMPAVLVEVAFLSNPSEEELLTDTGFQRKVVEGIVEAVRRLQSRYAAAAAR